MAEARNLGMTLDSFLSLLPHLPHQPFACSTLQNSEHTQQGYVSPLPTVPVAPVTSAEPLTGLQSPLTLPQQLQETSNVSRSAGPHRKPSSGFLRLLPTSEFFSLVSSNVVVPYLCVVFSEFIWLRA